MDSVYGGNNSNGVCFIGKYVHLETYMWELITPRVIWNTRVIPLESDHLPQVGSQMNIITSKHKQLYNCIKHVNYAAGCYVYIC